MFSMIGIYFYLISVHLYVVYSQGNFDLACSLVLDKRILALSNNSQASATGNVANQLALVEVTINVTYSKPKHFCGKWLGNLELSQPSSSSYIGMEKFIRLPNGNDFTEVLKLNLSKQSLSQFSTDVGSEIWLLFQPDHSNCDGEICGDKDTTRIRFVEDHAPRMHFQVLSNHDAVAGRNWTSVFIGSVEDSVTLRLNNLSSTVMVIADAQDHDVFNENRDAFEYSAISDASATLSATANVVRMMNESLPYGSVYSNEKALASAVPLQLNVSSCAPGTVEFKEICKLTTFDNNQGKVQYAVPMALVHQAVFKAIGNYQALQLVDNETYAFRVTMMFSFAIASGRENKQMTNRTFNLTVVMMNVELPQQSSSALMSITNTTSEQPKFGLYVVSVVFGATMIATLVMIIVSVRSKRKCASKKDAQPNSKSAGTQEEEKRLAV